MPSTLIRSTCLMLPDCAAAVVGSKHANMTAASSRAGRKRRTVTERPPEMNRTEREAYCAPISDGLTLDERRVKNRGTISRWRDGRPPPPRLIPQVNALHASHEVTFSGTP